jgi:hypothetical protein
MPVRKWELSPDRGDGSSVRTGETASRQAAAAALIVTGLIHAYYFPVYLLLYGAQYGIPFGAAAIACAWSVLLLLRRNGTVAWKVAMATWVGMVVLFVLLRIADAPGFQDSEGTGLLIAEGALLLIWIQWALAKRRGNATTRRQ